MDEHDGKEEVNVLGIQGGSPVEGGRSRVLVMFQTYDAIRGEWWSKTTARQEYASLEEAMAVARVFERLVPNGHAYVFQGGRYIGFWCSSRSGGRRGDNKWRGSTMKEIHGWQSYGEVVINETPPVSGVWIDDGHNKMIRKLSFETYEDAVAYARVLRRLMAEERRFLVRAYFRI